LQASCMTLSSAVVVATFNEPSKACPQCISTKSVHLHKERKNHF
jgi:hypothetical protein